MNTGDEKDEKVVDATLSIKSAETRTQRPEVVYTPKEAPASSKVPSDDAVKVVLSGVQASITAKAQESKLTVSEAEQLRKVLETEVNRTAVKFDVSVEQGSASSLRFVVVEQETGKVIREYPPEEVLAIKQAKEEQKKEAIDALV